MKNLFVGLSEANVTTCTNYCYSQLGRSFFTGFNMQYALHVIQCVLRTLYMLHDSDVLPLALAGQQTW